VLAVLSVACSVVLEVLGVPTAPLFGSLLAGLGYALVVPTELRFPPAGFKLGQALVGVITGSAISLEALSAMRHDVATIVAITLATVAVSLVAGRALALRSDVSAVTGTFALIAGGASGVVALADDLGADSRVVTVVQYLRVLLVLTLMPAVTALVFDPGPGVGDGDGIDPQLGPNLVFVATATVLGVLLARLVPFSTSILFAPMIVAVVLAQVGWFQPANVPTAVGWLAYSLIGAQVGLRFTWASLRSIARMLPVVVVIIVAMVAASAGIGAVLAWLTPVDGLTAYLATTPGGLFAVLATATDAGADATYVTAVQVVRVVVILSITPLLARYCQHRWPAPVAAPARDGPPLAG
jgi:membrane AbrB-like protein